jgi:hypothetical protein
VRAPRCPREGGGFSGGERSPGVDVDEEQVGSDLLGRSLQVGGIQEGPLAEGGDGALEPGHGRAADVVVVLHPLERRVDRRRVEALGAHRRNLGGERPDGDPVPAVEQLGEHGDDRVEVATGRGRVGQDGRHQLPSTSGARSSRSAVSVCWRVRPASRRMSLQV